MNGLTDILLRVDLRRLCGCVFFLLPLLMNGTNATASPRSALGGDKNIGNTRHGTIFRSPDPVFFENHGDVIGSDGEPRNDIVYTYRGRGVDVHFRWSGLSYVFKRFTSEPGGASAKSSPHPPDAPAAVETYRLDVDFPGAAPAARPAGTGPVDGQRRYYRSQSPGELSARRAFSALAYKDLYDGIDLVFYFDERGLKYDFILRPGADPSSIRMRYGGAQWLVLQHDGTLTAGALLGEILDLPPVAFTRPAPAAGAVPVAAKYRIDGCDISFELGPYDNTKTLTVDPGILWSTFYGGSGEDWANGAATDAGGNVFVTGRTISVNFPVHTGQQMSSGGNFDAFLVKFDAIGQRIWSTYLGGSNLDYGFGVATDPAGRVAVSGWTRSADFPLLNPAQPAFGGDMDAFVASFSPSGALRWSTYCGGMLDDRGMNVAADAAGNVVMTGLTFSFDFPVLSPQQASLAGFSDIMVVKYDSSGVTLWSTFHGGSGADEGLSVHADPAGNIAVAGRTSSGNYPVAGAAQSALAGKHDACLTVFTPNGIRVFSTYFGGSEDEYAYAVTCDQSGNIFAAGSTESDDFPILNAFQKKRGFFVDAWVAKFSSVGTPLWSTYYGGNSSEIAADAVCDNAGNVIIAGSSGSTTLPILNAPMLKNAGDDAFVARFSAMGALQFAAFAGGGNNEGASGVAWAGGQAVVIAGTTNSFDFPVRNPAQASHGGGGWDAFVVKLEDCPVGATVAALGPTRFCPGGSVVLEADDGPGYAYQWFKDGVKAPGGGDRLFIATDSGEYSVLVKNAAGYCALSLPVKVTISNLAAYAGADTVICGGTTAQLRAEPVDGTPPFNYLWTPSTGLSSATAREPVATPPVTTTYRVTIEDSIGCAAVDSVTVEVRTLAAEAGADAFLCRGEAAVLQAVAKGGTAPFRFFWTPSTGLDLTDVPAPTATPLVTTTYSVEITDALGCAALDSVTVAVSTLEVRTSGQVSVCEGEGAVIEAFASGGAGNYSYEWGPAAGLSSTSIRNPTAKPAVTTTYQVTVRDASNCSAGAVATVFVSPRPEVSIAASGPLNLCLGDTLQLRATPGFARYEWSNGAGTSSIRVTRGGVFAVTVWDSSGCKDRDSITVTLFDYPAPAIIAERPLVFCPGDSTILDGGAGYTEYLWSTGEKSRRITVRTAGTYTVKVTNEGGCAAQSPPVQIRLLPSPEPSIGGPVSVCPYTSAEYSVAQVDGHSYFWSLEGGSILSGLGSNAITARWGAPGAAAVRLTQRDDSSGCSTSAVLEVRISPELHPAITPSGVLHLCEGDSLTLDAGPGYASWQWTLPGGNRRSGRTLTVRDGGIYAVSVRDAAGCSGRDSVMIVKHEVPRPHLSTAPGAGRICEGDTLVLRIPGEWRSIRWSTGDTTAAISISAPGSFHAQVTDEFGCTGGTDTIEVSVFPMPVADFTGPASACAGTLSEYAALSDSGVSLSWFVTGGNAASTPGDDTLLVDWGDGPTGTVRLTAVVDSSGCLAVAVRNISLLPSPRPSLNHSGILELCEGDSAVLAVTGEYAGHQWSTGDTTAAIVVKASGVYDVVATDSNGCEGRSEPLRVEVISIPAPEIIGPVSVCVNSVATYRTAARAGISLQWSVSGGLIQGGDRNDSVVVLWTGSGDVFLRLRAHDDAHGCEAWTERRISAAAALHPAIRVSGPTEFCAGDSVILDAGIGYSSYTWTDRNGNEVGKGRFFSCRITGAWTVRVTDAGGCSGISDTVFSASHPLPLPSIIGQSALCAGDTIMLDGGAGFASYSWRDSAGAISGGGRYLAVTGTGVFRVQVSDAKGCDGISPPHAVVAHPPPPKPAISSDGDTLRSTPAFSHRWYRNDTLVAGAERDVLANPEPGRYTVRVTDSNGCSSTSDPYEHTMSIEAVASIAVPRLEAEPGERIALPIMLESSRNLDASAAGSFTATLRFDARLLVPVDSAHTGIISGVDRVVTITAQVPPERSAPFALYTLPLLATLGPVESTPLRIDAFSFNGAPVRVTSSDGEFRLRICREGGERLFDSGRRFFLDQNSPNPFNSETWIEYGIISPGNARLSVFDLLGRELLVIADAYHEPGRFRAHLDAAALTSGVYACVLRTLSGVKTRRMAVAK